MLHARLSGASQKGRPGRSRWREHLAQAEPHVLIPALAENPAEQALLQSFRRVVGPDADLHPVLMWIYTLTCG